MATRGTAADSNNEMAWLGHSSTHEPQPVHLFESTVTSAFMVMARSGHVRCALMFLCLQMLLPGREAVACTFPGTRVFETLLGYVVLEPSRGDSISWIRPRRSSKACSKYLAWFFNACSSCSLLIIGATGAPNGNS